MLIRQTGRASMVVREAGKYDALDRFWSGLRRESRRFPDKMAPYVRRILRFLALPYCYVTLIDWKECTASRYRVARDLLHIFFRLKYFPDNYSPCRFWEKNRSEWPYYYGSIYDPYQRGRLRKEVQRKEYMIVFDDKSICYWLCQAAGLPLPRQFACIGPGDDYLALIRTVFTESGLGKIIVKPVIGNGGWGISVAFRDSKGILVRSRDGIVPLERFSLACRSVVQEYVRQHGDLEAVAPSVNTVRIVTLYARDGEVIILGAIMRFGVGDALLDNISQGGVGAGVNLETGDLYETAYDAAGRKYTRHPDSGIRFGTLTVPYWNDVKALAVRSQRAFPFYRLLGHDIAIESSGPVVIEINSSHDNVGLERSFGPILRSPRVAEEFRRYDLLINDKLPG